MIVSVFQDKQKMRWKMAAQSDLVFVRMEGSEDLDPLYEVEKDRYGLFDGWLIPESEIREAVGLYKEKAKTR